MQKVLAAIAAARMNARDIMAAGRGRPRILALLLACLFVAAFVAALAIVQANAVSVAGRRVPPVDPVAVGRLATPIVADFGPEQPLVLDFSAAMDQGSVAAATSVDPPEPIRTTWDAASTKLTIQPEGTWQPGTFYTVSVGAGARSASGQPIHGAVRAVFLTAEAPQVTLAATRVTAGRASTSTGVALRFTQPVDLASLRQAFRITPSVSGSLSTAPGSATADSFTFLPAAPLRADTTYTVGFTAPVRALDGMAVAGSSLTFRTSTRPRVIRFRPTKGAQAIDPSAAVSVRFTVSMDHASTQRAFRLSSVASSAGTFSWAENDTVLVFQPAHPLQYGRAYVVMVTDAARSKDGGTLATVKGWRDVRSAFRVAARPQAATKTKTSASTSTGTTRGTATGSATAPKPSTSSGSSSHPSAPVAGAPWASTEQYALSLLNCTRTGGWVRSDGTCDGYGSGKYSAYVPPLTLSSGISSSVTRPYARLQAEQRACSHFLDGTPGTRLARAGYTSYQWGENIGCSSGGPNAIAVATELFFQSEKSYNGGHWANLKNAAFSQVGVGVWDVGGYTLVVFDFYHP